jgi:putative membrane protein
MFGGTIGIFLIILIIYTLFVTSQNGQIRSKESDALSILKERYAKGELDDEEYQRKKKLIEK